MTADGLRLMILFFFSMVLALFISAPLLEPYGAVTGLDGNPISPDHFDRWSELNPVSGLAYAVGDILCHQMESRSFIINGSEMPLCIRDVSALMGIVSGLMIAIPFGNHTSKRLFCIPFLMASFMLMGVDVVMQSSCALNIPFTRVVTGLLCGLSVAFIIDLAVRSAWYPGRSH